MAKQPSLVSQVRKALEGRVDGIGQKKDGTIVVRRGYFYRNGMDSAKFATIVAKMIADAGLPVVMKEHGDHWASFRGGASLATSSHFWVEFVAA
jgi:hypothetical protein